MNNHLMRGRVFTPDALPVATSRGESVFIVTQTLERLPTKAKDPFLAMRQLYPAGRQPGIFQDFGGTNVYPG